MTFSRWETVEACLLCGHTPLIHAYEKDIVRCGRCQGLFLSPRPVQEEIAASYDTGIPYQQARGHGSADDELWRRRLALVQRFCPSGGRLLDVGAGDGMFLRMAKAAGFDVTGTDISQTSVRLAQAAGLNVLLGQLGDLRFDRPFHGATLWHVLEHVPNPREVLLRLWDLLTPDGILVVAVPNAAHHILKAAFRRRKEAPVFPSVRWGGEVHLTHFHPAVLRRFVRSCGFAVLGFGIDPIYVLVGTPISRLRYAAYRALCAVTGWHPAVAMWIVARKMEESRSTAPLENAGHGTQPRS